MAESLDEELTAAYSVRITGVKRTRDQMAKLDNAIRSLRAANYGSSRSLPVSSIAGGADIAVALVDQLEGRVQTALVKDMDQTMKFGVDLQTAALQAAVTPTGANRGHGNGPGRDDTGAMIEALASNVELARGPDVTVVTGWHGWKEDARGTHIDFQERGTKGRGGLSRATARIYGSVYRKHNDVSPRSKHGVPAANSLGAAIVPVREALLTLMGRLR